MLRQLSIALLVILLFAACQRRAVPGTTAAVPFTFTILQLNDVYEIAPLEGGRVGGLARVATLLNELEREDSSTIAVIAGDFLSPSFVGNLKLEDGERVAGLQMVEALNTMGLDYATFGNHEFDLSDPKLLEKRMAQSEFEYTSSNATYQENGTRRPFRQGEREVKPYVIHTFREGDQTLRLAIVGTVLPFNQQDYVHYAPVDSAFKAAVQAASREADVVVGLTHLAFEHDSALATQLANVPLLMGGHEHENIRRTYNGTTITKADANAKTVYVHRFRVNPANESVELESTLVPITSQLADEPGTQAVVDRWRTRTNTIMQDLGYQPDEVLMTTTEPLEGKETDVRNRQTNYGRLAVSAFQAMIPDADVYLINSGSIRIDDNLAGQITAYDVLRSFPYGGPIAILELSGETLARILEAGLYTNRNEGGYMQTMNVERAPDGGWTLNSKRLVPSTTYRVVLPQFVASGREANLGFLSEWKFEEPRSFTYRGQTVRNDIRDIVMAYMRSVR